MPHPFAEGLEVSHVAFVPGGLEYNQGSNGMASLGQAFQHDIVAYKSPRYCFQPLLPGSQHFIFPKLPLPNRSDKQIAPIPAMQKRQPQCFGSGQRSCDTSTS